MGKEFEKEEIYVYVYLKLIQLCKSTALHYKIKMKKLK